MCFRMVRFIILFFFCFFVIGCVDKSYQYTTLDYKSMKIIKPEVVLDKSAWVDTIFANDETVIVNVMLWGEKTKRVFKKKEKYWYSELNYRHNPVKGTGQELYEVYQKYYIYPTYIIKESKDSNDFEYLIYLDLLTNEIFYFYDKSLDNFNLDTALSGDYDKFIFFVKDSELHKKRISFIKGCNEGESTEVVYGYCGSDIFFILDLEEYKIGESSFLGYMEVFGNE